MTKPASTHPQLGYLALGLAIGLVVAAILFGAAVVFAGPLAFDGGSGRAAPAGASGREMTLAARSTATRTAVPPATPTTFALPTVTPFATQTPDWLLAAVSSGRLVFSGPLTNDLQARLYSASMQYVQTSVKASTAEAKAINGVAYGDPSNICGPLAIAIMRDGGLIPSGTDPHEFWLLDPNATLDQVKLQQLFPRELYYHIRILTPINQVDWEASPLEPGDFLFLWHGSGGNFDHMLVVNRVDKDGRAYAVTNYGTPEGFLIAEMILYDPNDPTKGVFHTWTEQPNAILGSTGFGGYELWRRRTP